MSNSPFILNLFVIEKNRVDKYFPRFILFFNLFIYFFFGVYIIFNVFYFSSFKKAHRSLDYILPVFLDTNSMAFRFMF